MRVGILMHSLVPLNPKLFKVNRLSLCKVYDRGHFGGSGQAQGARELRFGLGFIVGFEGLGFRV